MTSPPVWGCRPQLILSPSDDHTTLGTCSTSFVQMLSAKNNYIISYISLFIFSLFSCSLTSPPHLDVVTERKITAWAKKCKMDGNLKPQQKVYNKTCMSLVLLCYCVEQKHFVITGRTIATITILTPPCLPHHRVTCSTLTNLWVFKYSGWDGTNQTCTPSCMPAETAPDREGGPTGWGNDRLIENRQRWKWCLASSHSWFFFALKGFPHPHHEFLSFSHLMKTSWMGSHFFSYGKSHQSVEIHSLDRIRTVHVLLLETKHRASLWNLMSNTDAKGSPDTFTCEKYFCLTNYDTDLFSIYSSGTESGW